MIERKEPNGRVGDFLLGSAMGEMALTVKILITPQSGEETQANIKSRVHFPREDAEQGLASNRTLVEIFVPTCAVSLLKDLTKLNQGSLNKQVNYERSQMKYENSKDNERLGVVC